MGVVVVIRDKKEPPRTSLDVEAGAVLRVSIRTRNDKFNISGQAADERASAERPSRSTL